MADAVNSPEVPLSDDRILRTWSKVRSGLHESGAARAALDSRAGRTLTDADWAIAKDRLLEFFNILRGWGRKARAVSRNLVMCEVPCLPEL
jgi:hypothetical protein